MYRSNKGIWQRRAAAKNDIKLVVFRRHGKAEGAIWNSGYRECDFIQLSL